MSDEARAPSIELGLHHPKRKSVKREMLRAEVMEMLKGRGQTFGGFVRRFGYRRALPGIIKELINAGLVDYEPTYRTTGGWVGFFRMTEFAKTGKLGNSEAMELLLELCRASVLKESDFKESERSQGCPPRERSDGEGERISATHEDSPSGRSELSAGEFATGLTLKPPGEDNE